MVHYICHNEHLEIRTKSQNFAICPPKQDSFELVTDDLQTLIHKYKLKFFKDLVQTKKTGKMTKFNHDLFNMKSR